MEDIIKKRIQPDNVIGFCTTEQEETADNNNILKQVTEEDLINYGASSQIVGRMNTICVLNSLTQETLQEIITQSHNSPITSLNRLINTTQNVKISITERYRSKESIQYYLHVINPVHLQSAKPKHR